MRGLSIVVLISIFGCSASHEEISGINWEDWKGDRNGCLGKRLRLMDSVDHQKEKLKAWSEMDIVGLMGRPDATELYKRNQKFFTYYISAGPGCSDSSSASKKLVIRFNAIGLAKEVSIE